MIKGLISILRTRKQLRRPLTALHYNLWRTTGLSGVSAIRPELRPLSRIARRSSAAGFVPRSGQRILFFSFRAWNAHTITDALLAHALRLRGADVRFFTCGGRLPVCDIASHILAPPMPCNMCAPFVTQVAATLKLPCGELRDFITQAERIGIMREVQALRPHEFEEFEVDGLPVGKLVRPSLQWFMLTGSPSQDPETMDIYRRFLVSGAVVAIAAGRLLDFERPQQLFLLNGVFFAERLAIEQARRRGIPFITHEGGFMPDTNVYARNGFAPHHDLSEFWPRYESRALTPKESSLLDTFLNDRSAGKRDVSRYYPTIDGNVDRLTTELGLDRSKPVVTLFTNVDWDTATFAARSAFDNMEHWIRHTVQYFATRPDHQLVIRIHPAEVRLPFLAPREPVEAMLGRHFPVLPLNVSVVPPESPLSSYALMELSALGLVYTSTVGMEMSLRGKVVVVAGRSYYANRGFTFDARNPTDYDELVERGLKSGPLTAEQIELARRYAFLFFFRHHIAFRLTSVNRTSIRFNVETLDDLQPGRDPDLDLLCDAVLHGKPFLYEGVF